MTEIDGADLDHYILHLHDETRWPAKYFKAVIRYALAHVQVPELEPPEDICYMRCVNKYRGSASSTKRGKR